MENEIKIYVDWIRHGFSCSNAINTKGQTGLKNIIGNLFDGKLGDSRGVYTADSHLADIGIRQTEKVKNTFYNRIKKYDLLLCSELTRAAETAMIIGKNIPLRHVYLVPYISEERSVLSLSLDSDNQARDPHIIKKELENILKPEDGYPYLDISYVNQFIGNYNPKNKTQPNFNLFFDKVLPYIISKKLLPQKKKLYRIGIVSHNYFIDKVFKTRYPDRRVRPIENLQINTEIIKILGKKIYYELPENCKDNQLDDCQIPLEMQYDVLIRPENMAMHDVNRCIDLSPNKEKLKQIFKQSKGGYYDKYMKYKSKYLSLKNNINGDDLN